ncbi:MAG: hypothetical protein FJ148_27790, partial [Deltaproteobacteria bacterium]|nr:hypothetical protein [Deltaproteobacteria bacterium]
MKGPSAEPYPVTRRQLLERAGAAGILLASAGLFDGLAGAAGAAVDPDRLVDTLTFSNWTLYID